MTFGVYIGRFQPFHLGHQLVLNEIIANNHFPFILIGSANECRTERNPLTSYERQQLIMFNNSYSVAFSNFKHIPDFPKDEDWVQFLLEIIPKDSIIYYFRKQEDVKNGEHYIDLLAPYFEIKNSEYSTKLRYEDISATKIRENLEDYKHWLSGNVYNFVKPLLRGIKQQ